MSDSGTSRSEQPVTRTDSSSPTGTGNATGGTGSPVDSLLKKRPLWGSFIDGEFRLRPGATTFDVLEAATGKPLAAVAESTSADVDLAVTSARHTYDNIWGVMSPRERADAMREVAARIRANAAELAELTAREVGKPLRDAARVDIVSCHSSFDYYAGIASTLHGEIIDQGPIEARVYYEPYGVAAAILPFNWPPIHFSKKCAPALAAGNTVVIKPGEQAPLTVLRLVEIANEVLPPGVINAVSGLAAGAELAGHPVVERISFTGSTATGRKVLESAAKNLTYATLELGGKNALIVLDDADVDLAVRVAIEGMFYNQGEACTSTARLLVHQTRYEEFAEKFIAAADALEVGDPMDSSTDIGPMVDAKQQQRVEHYARDGVEQGAKLLWEGRTPSSPRFQHGFFVKPRILGDVTSAMNVAQDEIFGPVACLMRFDEDHQAIEIANGTDYGLTAAICTRDEGRAARLARRLAVGMVFVNNYTRRTFIGSPFGGVKGSGFGREYAEETLREFVRAKNVRFPSGRGAVPGWPPRTD
ncbi:aldehyde dehydrogenase family protein [Streptomyces sp. NPDC051219]|uniref:aldehyde dehydrogenase family protein n=1 Tax=Streptomyces sp. NPDC051219 TaxID=3155283 RepID=UPI0034211730